MAGLRKIEIPDFGTVAGPRPLPASTYAARCDKAYAAVDSDWLAVYADREHFANIMFLTGFEPRFEEALLLIGPSGRRIVITGNECVSYTTVSPLAGLEVLLCQTMSLLGQDRTVRPRLTDVLVEAGLTSGQSVALVGWKYLEAEEWDGGDAPSFVPAVFVEALRRVVGRDAVVDRTPVLLHPETGQRSLIDADQIAIFEAAASTASAMVWRVVSNARDGDTELSAASRAGSRGEPFNVHMMLASGNAGSGDVIGLCSPSTRTMQRGDGVTTAVGLWGGLTARAGLLADEDADFLAVATAYFAGLVRWYATADIGVEGGALCAAVGDALAAGGLRSMLNPGHLTGHEEWSNTPIRPGSVDRIRSGMHMQVDVIPTPMRPGWALNCEDTVVFADAELRRDLATRHPEVAARIDARRSFMRETLGVPVADAVLPLSSTPLCLAPFWLRPEMLLTAA